MKVLAAAEAFGSEVRLRLIRHFLEHPGRQADAARALGVTTATVARNTGTLVALGVIHEAPDPQNRRAGVYSVDLDRYYELVDALRNYAAETQTDTRKGE